MVILGGGDTGADCLGTAHRQGALSVTTLAIGTRPPEERQAHQPWPTHPLLFELSTAHEEGGKREFLASTVSFLADEAGAVTGVRVAETEFVDGKRVPKSGSEHDFPAELILLALGFSGTETGGLQSELNLTVEHGNIVRDAQFHTSARGVFAAGDAGRGQSLIVWAIAEGRAAAAAVDRYLEGDTELPMPVHPTDHAISL